MNNVDDKDDDEDDVNDVDVDADVDAFDVYDHTQYVNDTSNNMSNTNTNTSINTNININNYNIEGTIDDKTLHTTSISSSKYVHINKTINRAIKRSIKKHINASLNLKWAHDPSVRLLVKSECGAEISALIAKLIAP